MLNVAFRTPSGRVGLLFHQGTAYSWYGEQWHARSYEWLRQQCWVHLVGSWVAGADTVKPLKVTPQMVYGVTEALSALCQVPMQRIPCWLGEGDLNPEYSIATTGGVHDIIGDRFVDRNERYFEPMVLPCELGSPVECRRWMRCLEEWSDGDGAWKELLRRWMGYCLIPSTRLAKWMLFHGKARSGKGTITKVMRMLLGDAYVGTSLYALANTHGLEGIQTARSIVVNEVARLDRAEGQRCVQVLKCVLGQDLIDINPKGRPLIRNVRLEAKVTLVANMIPRLPNEGQALSSKMLVLPFDVSFAGREDEALIDELGGELRGIAGWASQGVEALLQAEHAERWPVPRHAAEHVQQYLDENNPYDSFLRARFLPEERGFVATDLLWSQWQDWRGVNNVQGVNVSRNRLASSIEQESSWNVRRYRPHGGSRGLRGLVLRRSADDEQ
jgi:putative DNA primase/helicase